MPEVDNYFSPEQDPYLNPDTGILENIPGLETQDELDRFEEILFQANFEEAALYVKNLAYFNLDAWKVIHQICFSDVYNWAGETRTVRISKGTTVFAYPEHIESESNRIFVELDRLLGTEELTLDKAAELFADINVLHPFREGNGRTQRILYSDVLRRIGYLVDYNLTSQVEMIEAMIHGYNANYEPIKKLMHNISRKENS
jgi:cell filamentation protein